jgi:hypothetical protein
MEETLRLELLAKTQQALDTDDWNAVEQLWDPWIQQGDAEAAYQLAYHYLWCTPCDDDAIRDRMKKLLRDAAAKDHPDAIWFLANRETRSRETDPEFERLLLRAGRLGSVSAQRQLGVMYATGDWSGPKDPAEAVRWYRLAAERGHAESQYDLGFMLLLGEGGQKNPEEGLMWLDRAGESGEWKAFRLLVDCYEDGYCDVPVDAAKAALWRGRMEEYERLHPPSPSRRYSVDGTISESSLECLWEIEGVIGFAYMGSDDQFLVSYDPALIRPAQLDERIRATGLIPLPVDS